jgi:hypothetical protein
MRGKGDEVNDTSSYRLAFDRIRAEYLEMPGMRLSVDQVHRLCGVDVETCRAVLEDLVRAKFLQHGADGTYLRTSSQSDGLLTSATRSGYLPGTSMRRS